MRNVIVFVCILFGALAWADDESFEDLALTSVEYQKGAPEAADLPDAEWPFTANMDKLPQQSMNFGYDSATIWIRFRVTTTLPPDTPLRLYFS